MLKMLLMFLIFFFLCNFGRLLSIYRYYKILAIFPLMYNAFLSLFYSQCFVPPTPPFLYCPSTPPLVITSVFSISVSMLFFLVIFISLLYFLYSSYKWYHTVFVWLISLNIMPSKSIHVAANGKISFLWLSSIPLCICKHTYIYIHTHNTSLSIHLLMDT